MNTKDFTARHTPNNFAKEQEMLRVSNFFNFDELISNVLPETIVRKSTMQLPNALSEFDLINHLKQLAQQNKINKSYIGFGYHPVILPAVIQRNILENPSWYTAYTPYQAEIAQGRLEALLNFQTIITDLTALPLANASLLDEATACAEAMNMLFANRTKEQKNTNCNQFFVSENCYPQNIEVVKTKAKHLGINLVIGNELEFEFTQEFFGILLQYPAKHGRVENYQHLIESNQQNNIKTIVAADILSLVLLTPPGVWGAEIVVGSTQRFGIPMGYGGPHAAYLAAKEDYKRLMPGRIIGLTQDKDGKPALRMALQTREQHIKRDKATSNICTAQVLLAVMASMYAVYHGKEGLTFIASSIHEKAKKLDESLRNLGFNLPNTTFFDTIEIKTEKNQAISTQALKHGINLNALDANTISIAINETTSNQDIEDLINLFQPFSDEAFKHNAKPIGIPKALMRTSDFLTHPVFESYHTETELMRYIKRLEKKDLALNHSMIPLGSCTMKLNAATELLALSWPEFGNLHPFVPKEQAKGYQTLIQELEKYLSEITGFAATSLQPNSGAQGEYAGLMTIRTYQQTQGQGHRNIVLIPESAHGTNPASAVLAGAKVVVVKNLANGEIDLQDLTQKAEQYHENLCALMVTYPSTYGVFDANIKQVTQIIHQFGGQVYMDGANMNAQVALTSPAEIGADVCHLNLHKTFAIPHGGGGPGVGPICVAEHLVPFLPNHPVVATGGNNSLGAISAAPYGSAFILTISYAYIRMLGEAGLKRSTLMAILNANYLKNKLKEHYGILYQNKNQAVAHEFIIDCRPFKSVGIEVSDIAKRLMDYGFHAPTVSFPVVGTMMIEPTESESKEELDRFADALIQIKQEINEVANGTYSPTDNVLKNAPHTQEMLTADDWNLPYSRTKAAYPLEWIKDRKFWASVRRVDDAYGDRNLICTCPDMSTYAH